MEQHKEVDFLTFAVKNIVEFPDDVKVIRTTDELGVLLTLDVNEADMGKVIGRMGNTAKALRTLLRVVGMSADARVNLKILDPNPDRRKAKGPEEEDLKV